MKIATSKINSHKLKLNSRDTNNVYGELKDHCAGNFSFKIVLGVLFVVFS